MESVTFFLLSAQPSNDLEVVNTWVYAPVGSPITNKEIVYTLIVGSPTIVVKVYAHYEGSPKHNINTIWQAESV